MSELPTSNSDLCWDEFKEFCEEEGISLEHKDDWGQWWDCWRTAIEKKYEYEEEIRKVL